ncbi:MAG: hypothetical protein CMB65_02340 [Euryarchaeota archaeon]|nr:hypothetical protein [Euryarchaeota archaeon]
MQLNQYLNRRNISSSIVLNLNREKLWELITSPGHLNNCHPFCKTNDIIRWEDDCHEDVLTYLNGLTYKRVFQNWDPGYGYDLLIGEENGPQSHVVWKIHEIAENQSSLTITVYPYLLTHWPRILSFIPFSIWIKPRLGRYLDSVLSGFDYFIKKNEQVPRNFKGKHPWFS